MSFSSLGAITTPSFSNSTGMSQITSYSGSQIASNMRQGTFSPPGSEIQEKKQLLEQLGSMHDTYQTTTETEKKEYEEMHKENASLKRLRNQVMKEKLKKLSSNQKLTPEDKDQMDDAGRYTEERPKL